MAGNTRAEQELGRRITEARAKETEAARAAYAKRQQEERDEEDKRRAEIEALGRGYSEAFVAPRAQEQELPPLPPVPAEDLPPPTEVQMTTRRSARLKGE